MFVVGSMARPRKVSKILFPFYCCLNNMIHQQTLLPSQKKKQNHFLSPNMNLQWNLSNPTQEGSREMCGTVQDVGILWFYLN
jgi:hypothetical protein